MVGLMIEKVGHRHPHGVGPRLGIQNAGVMELAGQDLFRQTRRPGAYALVHRLALGSKLGEILVQFLVEAANGKNLALESAEPDLVPQQQVIQRPVDGPEEGLAILLAVGIGHPRADLVQALIHPAIVGCHELGLLWSHRCCLLAGLWIWKLLAIVRKEDTRLRRIFAGFKVRRLPTARSKSAADPEDAAVTLGCRRGPRRVGNLLPTRNSSGF